MINLLNRLRLQGSLNTNAVYPPVALAVTIILNEILAKFGIDFSHAFFESVSILVTLVVGYFAPPKSVGDSPQPNK